MNRTGFLLAVAGLIFLTGCGSDQFPVRGKVVYENDQPVKGGGRLVFQPESIDGVSAVASYDTEGNFVAYTMNPGSPDGMRAGSYLVGVLGNQESPAGPNPYVDEKFADPTSSGIRVSIQPGENDLTIRVKRPPPRKGKKLAENDG